MGENNFKKTMEQRGRIIRDGISFKHLQENCKTIADIKKYHDEIIFIKAEAQADENISKIFNPKADPYKKKQREILNSIFGEKSYSVIKKQLNNST